MTEPLQDFHFKSNRYERPSCEWLCGRSSEGAACKQGPNRKGHCNNVNTCQPELVGDEYCCTRSKLDGGTCERGAFPDGRCGQKDERCQPVRSMRSRRRLVTVWLSAMVFGFCVWLFGSASPSDLTSPGELTFQHRGVSQNCSSCHTAAEDDNQHWMMSVFHSNIAIQDSKKCLECHRELGDNAFQSHGLSSEMLYELSKNHVSSNQSEGPLKFPELACATCHHEHRGIDQDLTKMSNNQCATCHSRQFEHIGEGHPEFTDFPYERRTRIYFDHNTHFKNYFKRSETISCSTCHQPDAAKQTMLTVGYEKSCANCHESQITDVDFPGVAFLQLPDVDLSVLTEKNIAIGEWPSVGNTKSMSELPPFMKLLLESDPNYTEAMKDLGDFDFRDIETLLDTKPEAVAKLIWSIKKLFLDVATNGQNELEKRLGTKLSVYFEKTDPSLADILVSAQQVWFPKLVKEYYRLHIDKTLQTGSNIKFGTKEIDSSKKQIRRGWYRNDEDLSIRFRPTGHADRFLKNWFEFSATSANNPKSESLLQLQRIFGNPSASGGSATQGPVASGRCLLCHTIDQDQSGKQLVNWFAKPSRKAQRGLNKFSHAPHITSGKPSCISCHQWESSSTQSIYRKEFWNFDSQFRGWKPESKCTMPNTSGFAPLNQAKCATCHNGQSTGDNCLKCHNYHHR